MRTAELEAAITGGLDAQVVMPPRVARYSRETYPDQFSTVVESGNLTIRLNDDPPPYGVAIFDERVAICGYDPDNVTVRVLVDTDAAEAREWAEDVYQRYWRETPTVPIERASQ
jgi:predicted transcriptional regulator